MGDIIPGFFDFHILRMPFILYTARIGGVMDPLTEQLAEALRVCADDLEAEVSAKYPESLLAYPCMVQDKEGDMANVVAARKLLAAYDAAKANGGCEFSDVTRELIERDKRGRRKYGVTLDRKDLSAAEWLQHMAEELLDAAGYALAAKREFGRQDAGQPLPPPPEKDSCQCNACIEELHASDCAVHNEPAMPNGNCDCGAKPPEQTP